MSDNTDMSATKYKATGLITNELIARLSICSLRQAKLSTLRTYPFFPSIAL